MHTRTHALISLLAVVLLVGGLLPQITGPGSTVSAAGSLKAARTRLNRAIEKQRAKPSEENTEAVEKAYVAFKKLLGKAGNAANKKTDGLAEVLKVTTEDVAPVSIPTVRFAESAPVRTLPAAGGVDVNEQTGETNEQNTRIVRPSNSAPSIDNALQISAPQKLTLPVPSLTFEGIDFADGNSSAPPDTNGDVGPNDFVQTVNTRVRVWDKNGNPRGPNFKQSSLFQPLGGICSQVDQGDPIVLYDRIANRWMISQFAFTLTSGGAIGPPPYHECIALSKTGDPTGSYFLYDFQLPGTEFPDYPKFGVWPDGYYMTTNQFNNGGPFDGAGAFSFDRKKMLVGDPTASGIYFNLNLTSHPEGVFGVLPSDHDGLLPPAAGAPNVFTYFTDDNFGDPKDGLRLFDFHSDFVTLASSTFTERSESTYANPLALAAYDARVPGGRAHVEQPPPAGNNTTDSLDSVGERMMNRLQYFNRNGVESLVGNFTVNVSGVTPTNRGTYQAGIRYFELQKNSPGGSYAATEQATFAPGAGNGATGDNRWMGSAAIDNQDNLAVGYSLSGVTAGHFPSLNFAARAFNDPPNGLFQGEGSVFAGTGVQRGTSNRWGDYSSLVLDPSDDCTFWFTSEYYTSTTLTFNWQTRIGRFKFATCSAPAQGTLAGTITTCDTGAPLSEAMVTVAGGPSNGFSTTTLPNGTYSLNLAPGIYTVVVTSGPHGCQASSTFAVAIANGATTTLNTCLSGTPNLAFVSAAVSGGNGNGVIDRDECNTVNVTLSSVGCTTAANIASTLTTSTPGVTITRATSPYPNLPVTATGVNTFPFMVNTSPGFLCGTPIALTLTVTYTGGANVFNFSLATCALAPVTVTGSLTAADPKAVSRNGRNAITSVCGTAKACPAAFDAVQRLYRTHTFTNGPTAACVTITTTPTCVSTTNPILPVAYLGSFDPNNLCANYLGDPGGSPVTGLPISFAVDVPANGTLVVAIQEVTANSGGCSGYSVTASGLVGNTDGGAQCTADQATFSVTDPLSCTGPGNVVTGTFTITNNGGQNIATATVALPPGLLALPGSCTASVGTCTVVNASTVSYSGTLATGQSVTVTYQAQVGDLVAVGTQLCSTLTASIGGGPVLTVPACITVTCPAVGPGSPLSVVSPMSDQRAGSVLIYNVYTSSTDPTRQNTRLAMTNINPVRSTAVHLFFVDGTSCSVADSYICLTANQTASFLASDLDPGTTGYLVAVATSPTGCPINFNYLIGDEYVKFQSGHTANLGAEAIGAIAGGLTFCNNQSTTATLAFDGISYNVLPRVLALDNVGSRADGNDTLLILNRLGGNLGTGASTLGAIFGILYDDAESSLSFSVTGSCQLRNSLSGNFPRTAPRFETFIPAGRTGWLKFFSQSDIAISGAAINFNPNAGATAGAFNQGHNLHILTNTSAASYVMPIFPPGC